MVGRYYRPRDEAAGSHVITHCCHRPIKSKLVQSPSFHLQRIMNGPIPRDTPLNLSILGLIWFSVSTQMWYSGPQLIRCCCLLVDSFELCGVLSNVFLHCGDWRHFGILVSCLLAFSLELENQWWRRGATQQSCNSAAANYAIPGHRPRKKERKNERRRDFWAFFPDCGCSHGRPVCTETHVTALITCHTLVMRLFSLKSYFLSHTRTQNCADTSGSRLIRIWKI